MANKYTKKWSTLFSRKSNSNHNEIRSHPQVKRVLPKGKIKCANVKKRKHLYTIDENVNYFSHCGEYY
jgi:hypothetical protein